MPRKIKWSLKHLFVRQRISRRAYRDIAWADTNTGNVNISSINTGSSSDQKDE